MDAQTEALELPEAKAYISSAVLSKAREEFTPLQLTPQCLENKQLQPIISLRTLNDDYYYAQCVKKI